MILNNSIEKIHPALRKHKSLILGSVLLLLYFLPLLINRENSYIVIHDNLDSEVAWRVVLTRNKPNLDLSGSEIVSQIMVFREAI